MITLDFLAELAALAYVLVLVLAAFDVVVPVLPSESAVVLGGVLAWQGRLHVVPLILAAAFGAMLGDHLSYTIGRWTRRGRPQPAQDRGKVARLQAWAAHQLDRRGPVLLVIARFIPGGRTAVTFSAGYVHSLSWRRFIVYDVIAGLIWATYAALLGYFGGKTFEDHPLWGVALALGIALTLGLVVEAVRHLRARRGVAP